MIANPADWPKGKQKHLAVGVGIYATAALAFAPGAALAMVVAAGIGKEAYAKITGCGHAGRYDVLATIAGGGLALALHQLLRLLL